VSIESKPRSIRQGTERKKYIHNTQCPLVHLGRFHVRLVQIRQVRAPSAGSTLSVYAKNDPRHDT